MLFVTMFEMLMRYRAVCAFFGYVLLLTVASILVITGDLHVKKPRYFMESANKQADSELVYCLAYALRIPRFPMWTYRRCL